MQQIRCCKSMNVHRLKWQEQDTSLEDARTLSPVPLPEVMFPGQTPSWSADSCCGQNTKHLQGE